MDQLIPDKPKKYSYCRNKGHHRGQSAFRQWIWFLCNFNNFVL